MRDEYLQTGRMTLRQRGPVSQGTKPNAAEFSQVVNTLPAHRNMAQLRASTEDLQRFSVGPVRRPDRSAVLLDLLKKAYRDGGGVKELHLLDQLQIGKHSSPKLAFDFIQGA